MPGLLDYSLPQAADEIGGLLGVANRFSPQGYTGGGLNLPGYLSNGQRATLRSEGTDYEKARRELLRNQPYSILGAMINPDQASLVDAIRRGILDRMMQTGYSPRYPANMQAPNGQ